ncbi:DNA-binding protein [Lysobacter sp. CCNWLW3]|uniref:DNA-binding protein n=1 Tax=unclassified Lysobacter TaxID=2635362 RepID=UPI002FD617A6
MNSIHHDFAQRLRHALDYSGFIKGRGRIGALAIQYNVSRETARKWLAGLSLPELQRMIDIARQQRVSFEWLSTGRGSVDGNGVSVRDGSGHYGDPDELQLAGLVQRLSRKKRRALIELLEPQPQ